MCLVLFVTACSNRQIIEISDQERIDLYDFRHEQLDRTQEWTLEGKMAIRDDREGGSGKFTWRNAPLNSRMTFRGALGRGAWELNSTDGGVELRKADGRVYVTESIEEMVRIHVGWDVPVNYLRWWIRGMEGPESWTEREIDAEGRLVSLTQRDWMIDFSHYSHVEEIELPGRITARKRDQSVKLVISHWVLGGATEK